MASDRAGHAGGELGDHHGHQRDGHQRDGYQHSERSEVGSGRAVTTLVGHTDWVNACAVTPDGQHAVSAAGGETLKVWEP